MGWRYSALAMLLMSGCTASALETGPAWPKSHFSEADGGESLAPHTASAIAAREIEVEAAPATPISIAPMTPSPVVEASSPVVVPMVTAPEEVITTEDIVIEVDD